MRRKLVQSHSEGARGREGGSSKGDKLFSAPHICRNSFSLRATKDRKSYPNAPVGFKTVINCNKARCYNKTVLANIDD